MKVFLKNAQQNLCWRKLNTASKGTDDAQDKNNSKRSAKVRYINNLM